MKYIISALTPEQRTYSSKKTAQHAEKIASLKHDGLPVHAACMLEQIDAFLRNKALVEKWNLVYQPLIYPLLDVYKRQPATVLYFMRKKLPYIILISNNLFLLKK